MSFSPDLAGIADDVLRHLADGDAATTWKAASDLGWPFVGLAEVDGGVGGELCDAAELAAAVAGHAALVPLWETGLAAWTLAQSGLPLGSVEAGATIAHAKFGEVELHTAGDEVLLRGRVARVPWLGSTSALQAVVVIVPSSSNGARVVVFEHAFPVGVVTSPVNEAGSVADAAADLHLDGPVVTSDRVGTLTAEQVGELERRTCVLRAAALYGAMAAAYDLTLSHVQVRTQFGKPLVAFQAVAHTLATIAVDLSAVESAIQAALVRCDGGSALAALVMATRASGQVAMGAHQLHGAIGVTREHDLHRYTTRLWAWRDAEPQSQRRAELELGRSVVEGVGDDALWGLVTGDQDLMGGRDR